MSCRLTIYLKKSIEILSVFLDLRDKNPINFINILKILNNFFNAVSYRKVKESPL